MQSRPGIRRRLAGALDATWLYDDGHGIKTPRFLAHTPLVDRFRLPMPAIEVRVGDLRLPFDALADAHTLVDLPVAESPHRALMQDLAAGRDPGGSDYVRRLRDGRLDIRAARPVGPSTLRQMRDKHTRGQATAESGTYKPLKVVRVAGRTYVADGKHTAAMLVDVADTARAIDVTPLAYDSFYWWMWERMGREPARFRRNLDYFDRLLSPAPPAPGA